MTATVNVIVGLGNSGRESDVLELEYLSCQSSYYYSEVCAEQPPEESHDGEALVVGLHGSLVVPVPPEEQQPVDAQQDEEDAGQHCEEPSWYKGRTFQIPQVAVTYCCVLKLKNKNTKAVLSS